MKTSNEKHAAIILKCLPRSRADRFLEGLDPESCSNVVRLMKDVEVTTEKLQAAIACLEREGLGGSDQPNKLRFDRAHGNGATRHQDDSPFGFLNHLDKPVLLRLFKQQHAPTAATILSMVPKEFASAILMDLEPAKRVEIIRHIASIATPSEKEIVELRFALRLQIQKMVKDPVDSTQTSPVAAEADETSVDESNAYEMLHKLSELSNKQIKKLLKRIDTSHLAPALKTLPIQLQRKVLRNMASKPAAIVSKEIVNVRIDEKHRIERSSRSVARAIKELHKKQA